MDKINVKDIVSSLGYKKNYIRSLKDLQYNLSVFLNEDVYFSQIKTYGKDSLYAVDVFLKANIIFISEIEKRVLLTPTGEALLIELNNMLSYLG